MSTSRDYSHMTGDARKRIRELIALEVEADERANFDEQHAHLHEWPDMDDS
jgi:hypothetical protein